MCLNVIEAQNLNLWLFDFLKIDWLLEISFFLFFLPKANGRKVHICEESKRIETKEEEHLRCMSKITANAVEILRI